MKAIIDEWRIVVESVLNEMDIFRRFRLPRYMIKLEGIADRHLCPNFGHWPKPGDRLPIWQGTEEQRKQFQAEVDQWFTDVLIDLKLTRDEEVHMSF